MEIEIKGIDDLRDAVNRLGLFAKTMTAAADKMDEALAAHIKAMDTLASRLETLAAWENERQNGRKAHGM